MYCATFYTFRVRNKQIFHFIGMVLYQYNNILILDILLWWFKLTITNRLHILDFDPVKVRLVTCISVL